MRTKKPKKKLKKYRALRRLRWGHVFDQPKGWEFTEADLDMPAMAPALRKWLRVKAIAEITEQAEQKSQPGKDTAPALP